MEGGGAQEPEAPTPIFSVACGDDRICAGAGRELALYSAKSGEAIATVALPKHAENLSIAHAVQWDAWADALSRARIKARFSRGIQGSRSRQSSCWM